MRLNFCFFTLNFVSVKRAHEHLYATAEYHSRKTAPSSYSVAVPPGLQVSLFNIFLHAKDFPSQL